MHILKVIEQMNDDFIWNIVKIDDTQFRFMPGHGTTCTIITVRQV